MEMTRFCFSEKDPPLSLSFFTALSLSLSLLLIFHLYGNHHYYYYGSVLS